MTYPNDFTLPIGLLEQISAGGLDFLPELFQIMINTAMQLERQKYLEAEAYERTENRQGYANGYKPKTVKTRLGNITFDIPQVREGGFYPGRWRKEYEVNGR